MNLYIKNSYILIFTYVRPGTGKIPVLEMALPFLELGPSSSNVFFWIPVLEMGRFLWCRYWQSADTGTSVTQFVPFLVIGSQFRYGALPVSVLAFVDPRTGTGLCARDPSSGTGLCKFRYWHLLIPVPELA
jgi:hypothetical protein